MHVFMLATLVISENQSKKLQTSLMGKPEVDVHECSIMDVVL